MPRRRKPTAWQRLNEHLDWLQEQAEGLADGLLVVVDPRYLAFFRQCARMTQTQLAERAGVDVSTVQVLETGRAKHPRYSTVAALTAALLEQLKVFGVDVDLVVSVERARLHGLPSYPRLVQAKRDAVKGRGLQGADGGTEE